MLDHQPSPPSDIARRRFIPVTPGEPFGDEPLDRVELAKWPPDDDVPAAPPAGGGAPAGGSFDMGDGNFKKGRFNPIAILIGVVLVVAAVVFLSIGLKQDAEKLTVEQAEQQKKAIFILPHDQQVAAWEKWGASDRSDELKAEALKQLAWLRDPKGVDLAIKALKDPSEPVKSMAATALAEYGSPMADKAKDALLAALKTAGLGSRPQIAWAEVVLGDSRAFDEVMKLYRSGHLSGVQRLGGGLAFDPELMVRLVSTDKLASLYQDKSPAVRQLVATVLARKADPKYTDQLIALLKDKDEEVARQAAPGLGKIGDVRAREPLLAALKGSDEDSRKKYLEALRDGVGTSGLVLALDTVDPNSDKNRWYQTKQIFDMIRKLADPRGGDSLLKYIQTKPNIHWQTEAALAMAEVGDIRAVPTLALRMRMDPQKIYSDQNDWEMLLKRDSTERVVAARMIADLAVLHPDKVQQIRDEAEDAIIFWLHSLPEPHANGLRALAAMGSTKDIDEMRKWANPDKPLPKEGQQPPMPQEWVIAQSALRYVGWLKDKPSWDVMLKMLKKRPADIDVTMQSLMQGGLAILGMSLRAVGVGAADGFSEWGDERAFKPLMTYIEDEKNNEQSRMEACSAMAWVANKDDMLEVAKKIQSYSKTDPADQFRRTCLLETLITRPVPGSAPALLSLLTPDQSLETRHQVARAIGKAGLDKDIESKLFDMMKNDSLMNDAALALILGGDPATAARAVAMYADKDKAALEELEDLWYRSFGYWSTEDLEQGRIFHWVDNAVAISRVEIKQTPQEWARVMLMKQFDDLQFDNGPHSFTRVVLRYRLWQMAKNDDKNRAAAIRTLKFMKEQGVLLALRDEPGETGRLASAAYHDLMNPKVVLGVKIPEREKK
jgi:HEAT repeat protein